MKVNTNIQTKPMKVEDLKLLSRKYNLAAFIWKPKNITAVFVQLQKYECLGCVTTASSKEKVIGEMRLSDFPFGECGRRTQAIKCSFKMQSDDFRFCSINIPEHHLRTTCHEMIDHLRSNKHKSHRIQPC